MENQTDKKICSPIKGCGQEKNVSEFSIKKRRNNKVGLSHICKKCFKLLSKKYYLNNKELVSERGKKNYQKTKNSKKEYAKQYFKENKEKVAERSKKWRDKNIERQMIFRSRKRAKKKGLEHNITIEDIKIPLVCPLLGIELKVNTGNKKYSDNSPSIDRIDSSKGYVKGNVMVISFRANMLKSDGTIEELELLLENLKKIAKSQ